MRIKVTYLGLLRNKFGKNEEQYEIKDGSSLSHLLRRLSETYGESLDKIFGTNVESRLDPTFIVTVNGLPKNAFRGNDVKLKDGDTVALMTLISGG